MLTLKSIVMCLLAFCRVAVASRVAVSSRVASSPQTFHLALNGSSAGAPPLLNPNRGFRMQIDNACLSGKAGQDALERGLATCKAYNMTVTLFYCYISRFWNVSQFPENFLQTDLPKRFATLREAGVTAVMNFAYMDGKTNFSQDVQVGH